MPSQGLRFTVRWPIAVVALLAVLLAFWIVPVARRIERLNRQTEHRQVAGEIRGAILPFESRVPVGVNPSVWACAVRETYTALFNICFAWDPPPSIEELYRLRNDLRAKLRDPVDIQSLEWIWDRVAHMGPAGKHAAKACRPTFEACFPQEDQMPESPLTNDR